MAFSQIRFILLKGSCVLESCTILFHQLEEGVQESRIHHYSYSIQKECD